MKNIYKLSVKFLYTNGIEKKYNLHYLNKEDYKYVFNIIRELDTNIRDEKSGVLLLPLTENKHVTIKISEIVSYELEY